MHALTLPVQSVCAATAGTEYYSAESHTQYYGIVPSILFRSASAGTRRVQDVNKRYLVAHAPFPEDCAPMFHGAYVQVLLERN
jgi:hypothetical protein